MSFEKASAWLNERGYGSRIIVPEQSSATVELAAAAIGVQPDEIAKTMSFLLGDSAILILTSGLARTDNRKFKDTFQTKAKMVPFDQVEDLVGHAPGGVCPFGAKDGLPVYLDVSLKKHDTVYPACGDDHSAVRLGVDELESLLSATWVDVCKDPPPAE
ncbi:MAG: YbaK/EbsC family protein [Clostridia bacterium]|nr:YbaK/EbsC family protein [Clostridia bacterium]